MAERTYSESGADGTPQGGLRISRDFGRTWSSTGAALAPVGVASSADGVTLAAVPNFAFVDQAAGVTGFFVSYDSGTSWVLKDSVTSMWTGVAVSWDGRVIAAVSRDLALSWDSGASFQFLSGG